MDTLLMEPNSQDRTHTIGALHRAGQHVTAVATQREALAHVRENFYDLIVLAAPHEGRMDLPALLRAFHWRWPQSLIIVLSEESDLPAVVAASGGAADALVVKPVDRQVLKQAIERAIRREKSRLQQRRPERAVGSAQRERATH